MDVKETIVVYLKPGELYASSDTIAIKTVLGSCVAVCLYDKINKVGGANHYLLPHAKEGDEPSCNYGEKAIPELINMVLKEGGELKYLTACVVGGSCSREGAVIDVGAGNIDIARKILSQYSIPILKEEVGGNYGRVIRFYPVSNELQIRKAGGTDEPVIVVARDDDFVQLTTTQSYFLCNMFSMGLERAQQSFSSMLGTPATIKIADVTLRPMGYVQEYTQNKFNDFVVNTGQREKGAIGEVVMMIDPQRTAMIVNGLLHRDLNITLKYDRMESSVIIELANIVVNAILGTLANHLEFTMMLRVPKLIRNVADLNTISFMEKSKRWKLSLATKTKITVPAWKMDTLLLLLVELDSPRYFFKKLMAPV